MFIVAIFNSHQLCILVFFLEGYWCYPSQMFSLSAASAVNSVSVLLGVVFKMQIQSKRQENPP